MRDLLLKLCRREDLTAAEAAEAFRLIMSGQASEAQIGGLLVGLASKGTTIDELVGAAQVLREKSLKVDTSGIDVVLDTCGTGGDVRHTFNISTAAALVLAGCGVKIVKHGNRSASSKSGSADVLEALGVKIDCSPDRLRPCLEQTNLCFAFARSHHPAMKHVAAARSSLAIPTIFNLLGPLTNPGGARFQILGVFAPELTDRLAAVLQRLGTARAWVVNAHDGLDEISTLGPTRVSELRDGSIRSFTLDARTLGLPDARLSDLQVNSVAESAQVITDVLDGKKGPCRDITLLNAAAGLVVTGVAYDLPGGLARAADAVDNGLAAQALNRLIALSNS